MKKLDLFFNPNLKEKKVIWDEKDRKFICNFSQLNLKSKREIPVYIYLHNIQNSKCIIFRNFSKVLNLNSEIVKWRFISIEGSNYKTNLEICK